MWRSAYGSTMNVKSTYLASRAYTSRGRGEGERSHTQNGGYMNAYIDALT